MPYFITEEHPDCERWAVVKENGELLGCHPNEVSAIDQMVAVSLAEDVIPGGTYKGDTFLPFDPTRSVSQRDELPSEPAPPEDQIEGSEKNKPGSAKGAGGDIKLSDSTEKALRNKVSEHNEAMSEAGKPDYTRTTYGQLAAVYRRGAGAYSSSHRPGISRGAWAMARVNAYLYLLRNNRPENKNYVQDNDLLPEAHPKSTRSDSFSDGFEQRQVDLTPPAYMRAAARRGLEYYSEGYAGDGLKDQTVREARAMAKGNVTAEKWVRLRAWIARHMADLDSPAADPDNDGYPSPGVVAHLLWGSGPSKRAAQRALDYADGVVGRLEQENEGRARGKSLSKMETRVNSVDFEIRETQDGMFFEGYAAVFDSPSEPLPFTERIAPGAFIRSLKSRNDVKILWNHDTGSVLGSTRAGTLKLTEDARGLRVEASLPNTTVGRDAAELLKRGDIDSMSFGFSVPRGGDEWNADGSERTLREIRLHEVSIVAFPAYTATAGSTSVRGLDRVAQRASVDADSLADAILKVEQGEDITDDDRKLLSQVIDELSPDEVAEADDSGLDMLALKKKKLALLMGL